MPSNQQTLFVRLALQSREFTSGMRSSAKRINALSGNVGDLSKRMINLKNVAVAAFAGWGVSKVADSFLEAAKEAEGFRVRLNTLLGSVQEGGRMFQEMSEFASQVPYQYREIMQAATSLSGVMRGGVDEVKRWMPMITDLAAVTGLTLQETTGQIIRMYSAGAAAADMFRERGVLAMMGFQAGVSYSAEETRKMMFQAWEAADSQFRGVTNELAKTWSGTMSMFQDLWFQFRNMVMDSGPFLVMKEQAQALLAYINKLKSEGKLEEWAVAIAKAFINSMRTVVGAIQLVHEAYKALQWGFAQLIAWLIDKAADFYQILYDISHKISVELSRPYAQITHELRRQEQIWKEVARGTAEDFDALNKKFDKLIAGLDKATTSFKTMGTEGEKAIKKIRRETENLTKSKAWKEMASNAKKMHEANLKALEVAKEKEVLIEIETLEKKKKENEKTLKKQEEDYKRFLENIHDQTADVFYDIFSGQLNSFGDFLSRMKDYFLRFLAELAAAAIAKPIVVPIVGSLLGGLGFGGLGGTAMAAAGLGGTGGALGGIGGLGSLGGLIPGVSGFLSTPMWTSATATGYMAPGTSAAMYGMAPSWGAALGAAGLAGLGYSTLGPMFGLPQGKYSGLTAGLGGGLGYVGGSAAGAALGGTLGSAVPIVGTIIGALLGGVLGSLGGAEYPPMTYTMEDINNYLRSGRAGGMVTGPGAPWNETGVWYHPVVQAYIDTRNAVVTEFKTQMDTFTQSLAPEIADIFGESFRNIDFSYALSGRKSAQNLQSDVEAFATNYVDYLNNQVANAMQQATVASQTIEQIRASAAGYAASWTQFEMAMMTGQLAPVQSAGTFGRYYSELLAGARAGGPAEYQALLQYASGTYLPFMKAYGPSDYATTFGGVMGTLGGMATTKESEYETMKQAVIDGIIAGLSGATVEIDGEVVGQVVVNQVASGNVTNETGMSIYNQIFSGDWGV